MESLQLLYGAVAKNTNYKTESLTTKPILSQSNESGSSSTLQVLLTQVMQDPLTFTAITLYQNHCLTEAYELYEKYFQQKPTDYPSRSKLQRLALEYSIIATATRRANSTSVTEQESLVSYLRKHWTEFDAVYCGAERQYPKRVRSLFKRKLLIYAMRLFKTHKSLSI